MIRWQAWLIPPHGGEMRRGIGALLLAIGLARVSGYGLAATSGIIGRDFIGWLLLVAGALVYFTWPWRLSLAGRLASAGAILCLGVVFAAVITSTASIIYGGCILSLLWEAGSRRHDC